MTKRWISNLILLCLSIALGISLYATQGWAGASGSGSGSCTGSGSLASNCDSCISSSIYENLASGTQIINAMFSAINNELNQVEQSFFQGIVGATDFQTAIDTALIMYVVMYGILIMLNVGTYRINEVAMRLCKVGIVALLTSPSAWPAFNTWVNTPVIGGMNQLISQFTTIAESGSSITMSVPYSSSASVGSGSGMDAAAFTTMFGSSMTTVFSTQLAVAIVSMMKTGFFGWLISLFLVWALVEFLMMMIGAIVTYAKAIIGLAFLFGIAPLFFIFLLFERSRPIFFNWVYQVITFALQPVMLFAFLSFYVALINKAVPYLLTDSSGNQADFCWTKWQSIPGALWDAFMWTPTAAGAVHPLTWSNGSGTVLPSPINVPNAIYFLMLCHLGRTFSKFIDTLASDIGGGYGPGTIRGTDIINTAKKGVGGALRGLRGKT